MMSSPTRFDRAIDRLKNNWALVGLLLLVIGITGMGQVVASIESMRSLWHGKRVGSIQEEARLELYRRGMTFSESDFLAAIRSGDHEACGLYLQAGISANIKD